MKHLIEIPLANGQTVIVEVDGAETSARPFTPRRGVREFVEEQIVVRVGQTFKRKKSVRTVSAFADTVLEAFARAQAEPERVRG